MKGENMENEMFLLSDKLKKLKEAKEKYEENLKSINSEINKTELELSDMMVNTETQSFNRSGSIFYLTNKTYASAKADKKEELYELLKDNGFGSLVTETVNANSLAAFVREQINENDDELPKWLEDKVNVYQKSLIRMRKAK
jgi:hypothetical protein